MKSSLLTDLENNMDRYNNNNIFTSKEDIIYTDLRGNIESAPMLLNLDNITILDNTIVMIGDLIKYEENLMDKKDKKEKIEKEK